MTGIITGNDTAPRAGVDLASALAEAGRRAAEVPFTKRLLAANLLARGETTVAQQLLRPSTGHDEQFEVSMQPSRMVMQDYTAVPMLVDLAALRDATDDPARVNPLVPVDIVIDHSVQAEWTAGPLALTRNESTELQRNAERFAFLKWAEEAIDNVTVHPPGAGIVHQINIERLCTLVVESEKGWLPETVLGTDSHTTMMNGLGVLGWGVGGMDAQSVLLGEALTFRMPQLVGIKLIGTLGETAQASDLALVIAQRIRDAKLGPAMIEFCGSGVGTLSVPDRCTVANMAPEYGVMSALFPTDAQVLDYLALTGRPAEVVEAAQQVLDSMGLMHDYDDSVTPCFDRVIEIDLSTIFASLAGPSRPDQLVSPASLGASFGEVCEALPDAAGRRQLSSGAVAIAAITSCTNTANPAAMIAAGLLARRARERGCMVPSWVKTSLSPGSPSVTKYLSDSGLLDDLEHFGFHVAGYGCMTCNGGGGELLPAVSQAIENENLQVAAVVSGNRNFPGRVHADTAGTYLTSPALVVAMAIAGTVALDLHHEPIALDQDGQAVMLSELWPSREEIAETVRSFVTAEALAQRRQEHELWQNLQVPSGARYPWSAESTYLRSPSYVSTDRQPFAARAGFRVLLALGDNVTTDDISPVGSISLNSVAGKYLRERGEKVMNSFGSRRGNHEVMARGAFSNAKLRNALTPDSPAGHTVHWDSGDILPTYEAAARYRASETPLVVLAGQRYGSGSSRDWAAKAPGLLGVQAVLAESFESIHRNNLCAMGIAPIVLPASWRELGLSGAEELELSASGDGELQLSSSAGHSVTVQLDIRTERERRLLSSGGVFAAFLEDIGA
ncbi:aconitate hydratase [Psychromicrobium lacuslunae]|uniref:aconitate hydratase n=1 Tax=Psychromicrobium lacuslunae TaxID=1618207 RepID=UPI0005D34157|nr:aconitate hydratase AcnA [Psychromicrobium lacuslunae]